MRVAQVSSVGIGRLHPSHMLDRDASYEQGGAAEAAMTTAAAPPLVAWRSPPRGESLARERGMDDGAWAHVPRSAYAASI